MAGREQRDHEFTYDLANGDTIRLCFDLDRGRVTAFTVQLEIYDRDDGRWRPAVRCDSAHRRPHRDILNWTGGVERKDWLPVEWSLNEAMTEGERDLRTHHVTYREEFVRRKPR